MTSCGEKIFLERRTHATTSTELDLATVRSIAVYIKKPNQQPVKMLLISHLALAAFGHLTLASQNQIPLKPTAVSTIPLLGFGTWNLKESNNSDAVSLAIRTGYRHIDCAAIYGNEKEIGKGIADGLKKAGLERSDIWVTSKLWNDQWASTSLVVLSTQTPRLTTSQP